MQWKYKAVMFLTLLIFCVGSVCATEPNNTTNTNLTDNQKVDNGLDTIITTCNLLKEDNAKQAIEIQNLKDNNTQLDKRVKTLEESNKVLTDSNKVLTDKVQVLEYSKLTQSNRIKSLEIDIKNLEDSNKQLINSNKLLIDSNKQKDIDIKELKDSNNNLTNRLDNQSVIINELNNTVNNQSVIINSLKTDNEALNVKIDNQNSIINELNNKLDLQSIEIHTLQADKDKLNAEIKEIYKEKDKIYEKLLSSPKKEDYEQLKKDIINKNNKIKELTVKINKLNSLLSVSGNDVVNSLKHLSSTKNIKCGKYTFSLDEYLKIPLIKYGKDRVLKYKKTHGKLPNYVTIAGYKVPKNVYKKLYNL